MNPPSYRASNPSTIKLWPSTGRLLLELSPIGGRVDGSILNIIGLFSNSEYQGWT
jgi:hypothetical protein